MACYDRPASLLKPEELLSLRCPSLAFNHLKIIIPTFDSSWQQLADQACQNQFDLLGSGLTTLDPLNWHLDFRLSKSKPTQAQFPYIFYADIAIPKNSSWELGPDIKLPWELSRCQHLPVLGLAWQATGEIKYRDCFLQHIESWIAQNPPLMGVNWKNGMEVGIRSANWIWAAYFFESSGLPTSFWHKFNSSLLDHMTYLESNWEVYDTITNNHYLSNLLGYLYLCYYFGRLKQARWCLNKFKFELRKQILPDGTSYEGSTGYHRLVTEITRHFQLCAQELGLDVSEIESILDQMLKFLADCSPGGQLILIGDHDSGRITKFGFEPASQNLFKHEAGSLQLGEEIEYKPCTSTPVIASLRSFSEVGVASYLNPIKSPRDQILTYPDFGLKILKSGPFYAALRQSPKISPLRPVSHCHRDNSHLTIFVNNQPILIDPGTYVYSASSLWDGRFRSAAMHNQPNLGEAGQFERNIVLDHDQLTIIDTIKSTDLCTYRFVFHPQVALTQITPSLFEVWHQDQLIGSWISPDLDLEIKFGHCALEYGRLSSCFWLEGQAKVKGSGEFRFEFRLY